MAKGTQEEKIFQLRHDTLLNHSGLLFFARASVDPNPAIIPADATAVRKTAPAHRKSGDMRGWPQKLGGLNINSFDMVIEASDGGPAKTSHGSSNVKSSVFLHF